MASSRCGLGSLAPPNREGCTLKSPAIRKHGGTLQFVQESFNRAISLAQSFSILRAKDSPSLHRTCGGNATTAQKAMISPMKACGDPEPTIGTNFIESIKLEMRGLSAKLLQQL